jgi:FkbM family methyltransferase
MKITEFLPFNVTGRALKLIHLNYLIKANVSVYDIFCSILSNNYIQKGDFVLSNYGVWLKNNFYDRTFILALVSYRNGLDKILLQIKVATIFIDIGANQGIFSLIAAKNPHIIEIHSFEPNTLIFKKLQENVIFNQISNIKLHRVAISKIYSRVYFSAPNNHSGLGKISSKKTAHVVKSVNRNYLNKIFSNNTCEVFIKIDVEGLEFEVLCEILGSRLNPNIRNIYLEFNPKYKNRDVILIKLLNENGFSEKFRTTHKDYYDSLYSRP